MFPPPPGNHAYPDLQIVCSCYSFFYFRVLLDQLLQYEPISDEEEEVTDYSSDEDAASESKPYRALPSKQVGLNGLLSYHEVANYIHDFVFCFAVDGWAKPGI